MFKKLWHKWKYRNKFQREYFIGNSSRKFIFSNSPTSLELQKLSDWRKSVILEGIIEKHHGLSGKILHDIDKGY